MEISSNCGKLVSEDVNKFIDSRQSSVSQEQPSCAAIGEGLVNELGTTLGESLHIHDAQGSVCILEDNIQEGNLKGELLKNEAISTHKCLCKCATFPCYGETLTCDASTDEDETDGTVFQGNCNCSGAMRLDYSRSISLPSPSKLVSALKGSREKEGTPLKKLSVKWAPEVYDPIPTIVSHTVKSKNQQRSKVKDKKSGKNKQKGKASRGSSGKDKKQYRKHSANSHSVNSEKCYKPLDVSDRLWDNKEDPCHEFDVGSTDSYCGSSFLGKSFPKVQRSVAEAS